MSRIDPNLVSYLKRSEGYRGAVYDDVVGYATVGYGHLIRGPSDFKNIDLNSDGSLDKEEAHKLLIKDIKNHQAFKRDLKVPISTEQEAAITSLAFNIGARHKAIKRITNLINQGKLDQAGNVFLQYDKAKKKKNSPSDPDEYVALKGLTRRRREEAALFTGEVTLEEFGEGHGGMKGITGDKMQNASAKTYLSDLDGMEGKWKSLINQIAGAEVDVAGTHEYLGRLRAEGSGL